MQTGRTQPELSADGTSVGLWSKIQTLLHAKAVRPPSSSKPQHAVAPARTLLWTLQITRGLGWPPAMPTVLSAGCTGSQTSADNSAESVSIQPGSRTTLGAGHREICL